MKPSLIFQIGMKFLTPFLLLVSVVLFWRGHQLPGGGFIGGLVAGATLATHAFCFSAAATLRLIRLEPLTYVFLGLFFALVSGLVAPILSGGEPFQGVWHAVFLVGDLGTPQLFDLGVYLLVMGLVVVFVTDMLKEDT